MTPASDHNPATERVTLDDIKRRAEAVKTRAVTEAKDVVDTVVATDARRTLAIVAGVVILAAGIAYFLGTRNGRAAIAEEFFE